MLRIEDVSLSFQGEMVLDKLNMAVTEGEFVSILGPSGCGKSTLLNIIAGVLPSDGGRIFVDNQEVRGLSSHFAYMPQQDLLMEWKTILNNVILHGTIHGKKKEYREKALKNFERFGLSGYENKFPSQLSGGMRQRAAFLRTALCNADILLLDEPFGALDVITRGEMQDWLISMRNELSRTTLLVTHDIHEAIYLSDRVLILSGQPACFVKEFQIKEKEKSRDWLFEQKDLEKEIYSYLKGDVRKINK